MSESSLTALTAVELRMRIVLALALLLVGCKQQNSGYCGVDMPCPDGQPVPCEQSTDTCVCLDRVCVECTADDERNCDGTTPQCGPDNRCHECRSNDDCSSGACLEDGSCAAPARVIYAAPGGVNTGDCGRVAGQNECSIAQALIEVKLARDVIRLAPGPYIVPSATVDGLDFSSKSATLVARGATLTRMGINGAIIAVRAGQTLKIVGGTVQGPNSTTDGIKCADDSKLSIHEVTVENMTQSGIETNACQLTVSRSTLRDNRLGGINMVTASVATITNNFVYRNGGAATLFGGMSLRLDAGSKLELNTVTDNIADANNASAAGGILCTTSQGYDAPFNLVYRNVGGTGGKVQVLGTCTFVGSYQMGADPGVDAVGFENPTTATPSYRLTEASPLGTIRDAFDCTGFDFERDPRPSPSAAMGGKCDYGADEYRIGQ